MIVSGFVALTLSPMMCSKLLRHDEKHGWFYRVVESFLRGLTKGYRTLLRGALKVRPLPAWIMGKVKVASDTKSTA